MFAIATKTSGKVNAWLNSGILLKSKFHKKKKEIRR